MRLVLLVAQPLLLHGLGDFDESYAGSIDKDPLVVPDGPITRSRAKKIKEAIAGLVQSTWAKLAHSPSEAYQTLIHVIQAKEELA